MYKYNKHLFTQILLNINIIIMFRMIKKILRANQEQKNKRFQEQKLYCKICNKQHIIQNNYLLITVRL